MKRGEKKKIEPVKQIQEAVAQDGKEGETRVRNVEKTIPQTSVLKDCVEKD